jgi:hypothetical protein
MKGKGKERKERKEEKKGEGEACMKGEGGRWLLTGWALPIILFFFCFPLIKLRDKIFP